MDFRVLAIGDIVGDEGVQHLTRVLPGFKRFQKIDLVVANGENAAGLGLLPRQVEELQMAGVDVITMGNHTWAKQQIFPLLEEKDFLIRPANVSPRMPGHGVCICEKNGVRIGVINLIGRCNMDFGPDNPFSMADQLVKQMDADLILVDFHAEATSEKLAMAYYLDGRITALWGTHTHVPTADERVFPKGTGYITDLGMTGPLESVLGIRPNQSVTTFLGGIPGRYAVASGPCKMEGCLFIANPETGLCQQVERLSLL